jgi:prepilin-type N-terminal cleavage/methylation domain-containing protein
MRMVSPKRVGFTLVEMLVVMAMIVVLGGVMAKLLVETIRAERTQREGLDKILHDHALADQFRIDVAQAESAPEKWRDYVAGKDSLILQMPGGGQVVYLWKEKALRHLAVADKTENERRVPTGADGVDVEFSHDPLNPKLIVVRLYFLREGKALPGQALEIAAALGGDLR